MWVSSQTPTFAVCKHNYIWLQLPAAALLVSPGLCIRRHGASWAYGSGHTDTNPQGRGLSPGAGLRAEAHAPRHAAAPAAGRCRPRGARASSAKAGLLPGWGERGLCCCEHANAWRKVSHLHLQFLTIWLFSSVGKQKLPLK